MKIELRDIHKHYGRIRANQGISITFESGKIHGILGENGAGKSTLMKILSGFTQKTSGEILLDESRVEYRNPADAAMRGIGMLYQEPLDFPVMTILENYLMGQSRGIFLREEAERKKMTSIAGHLRFSLSPYASVQSLTPGERQQLEIVRLLSIGIRVLILDEPTTGISSLQKEILFEALRKLAAEGKTVIMVSHKLEDIEALCEQVTVLRQGAVTGEARRPFNPERLLEMVFGSVPKPPSVFKIQEGNP
ncbi:MAG: ATP-binding cassette domain-containing protein, partial [Thermodesulfobacteriota bacterium]